MDARDQATQPFQLFFRFQRGRASAMAWRQGVAIAFAIEQGLAIERQWCDDRDFRLGQFAREGVLFEDRRVAPAARPVELGDHRSGIFDPYLPYAIFVAVEHKQSPVGPQIAGFDGTQYAFGIEIGVRCVLVQLAAFDAAMTAMVMRDMHTSCPVSFSMRISQTCVLRPRCSALAVPVTIPLRTPRIWLALMSSPTVSSLLGSSVSMAAVLPRVSASATEAPPCSKP